MIGYLAELGEKAGFKIWIGKREQGDIYKGKRLSELSENKHRLSFSSEELENIEMIDVLWIKNNEIIYEFEVENTTSITEAITRGSYIPSMETKRLIIIPEEREKLLFKKVNAPILKDRISKYKWQFIFYKDLEEFYLEYKRKREIDLIHFDLLAKTPKQDRQKQMKIEGFN